MFQRQRQPPLDLLRLARVQPVVKAATRRVSRIQLLLGQFARRRRAPAAKQLERRGY